MARTLRECLLEGGVKGKRFKDNDEGKIYEIKNIYTDINKANTRIFVDFEDFNLSRHLNDEIVEEEIKPVENPNQMYFYLNC